MRNIKKLMTEMGYNIRDYLDMHKKLTTFTEIY